MPLEHIRKEFNKLIRIADIPSPDPKDTMELKRLIIEESSLVLNTDIPTYHSQQGLLIHIGLSESTQKFLKVFRSFLKKELGYKQASTLGRIVIDQTCNTYLKFFLWEYVCDSKCHEFPTGSTDQMELTINKGQILYLQHISTIYRYLLQDITEQQNKIFYNRQMEQ
jgi:hypothetical protein